MPGGRGRWESPRYTWNTLERTQGSRHYKSAARNLRKAAAILAEKSKHAYGLDRSRLGEDVGALRG
jgi:hypothetical protein